MILYLNLKIDFIIYQSHMMMETMATMTILNTTMVVTMPILMMLLKPIITVLAMIDVDN